MSNENYNAQNPVVEGHFKIECLDKEDKVIDSFEDHNMIVVSARRSMAELFFNLEGSKFAHKLVLGTHGCKEEIFKGKTEEDGFVKERDHIFSEVPETIFAQGTLFEEIFKGDILKVQDIRDITKFNYWRYNGEYAKNFVVDEITLKDYFTKLTYTPYTYTINFKLPQKNLNGSENCVVADRTSDAANDMVQVQLKDTSVIFTFYVDVNNGNAQEHNDDEFDSPTTLFNEAGLYVNDRLFSFKTFGSKVKDESVKLRIVWTITF